jgi:hypothetical protein
MRHVPNFELNTILLAPALARVEFPYAASSHKNDPVSGHNPSNELQDPSAVCNHLSVEPFQIERYPSLQLTTAFRHCSFHASIVEHPSIREQTSLSTNTTRNPRSDSNAPITLSAIPFSMFVDLAHPSTALYIMCPPFPLSSKPEVAQNTTHNRDPSPMPLILDLIGSETPSCCATISMANPYFAIRSAVNLCKVASS